MLEGVRCGTGPSSRVRVRAPPVQHLLRGGYKRGVHAFQGGQRHTDTLVYLRRKRGAGGRGEAIAREAVLVTSIWGMLYADGTGVVSQSSE